MDTTTKTLDVPPVKVEITEHETNLANSRLDVFTNDEPTHGNAHHYYVIDPPEGSSHGLQFQKGPIKEKGVNGITHEALLAIILHRLRAFQTSEYKCRENVAVINLLEEALMWLHKRTQGREARGVEGTHKV